MEISDITVENLWHNFWDHLTALLSIYCCSVAQLCPTLCDSMDYSTPGFLVLHHLLELAQTHVHWVGDAIQPSHSLSSPSPPTFNLSQHQGLFQWVSSSNLVVKALEPQLEHQSFQWIFRIDFLQDWLVWSPCHPKDSQESSPTPQFKSSSQIPAQYQSHLNNVFYYLIKMQLFFPNASFLFSSIYTSFCLHMYLPNDLGALW